MLELVDVNMIASGLVPRAASAYSDVYTTHHFVIIHLLAMSFSTAI